ncbi:RNA-directed DNA polymerase from mobile element jockey [Elysia marginata]|uniref:RNA-directed DNA polymerase from mobile element jockey n=1 Tax=Elysia marginata TaxID=1093978 RepID=A0AAV4HJB6_9GAST|nr:RNA-directed DNA polymerase from mobile element jockey [Elysia marginata]
MTETRQFHVILGGEKSKTRKIRNGVPQGSVIEQTLFNIYISDMPETNSLLPGYADDWVLTHQSKEWTEIEDTLSKDTTAQKAYFDIWYPVPENEHNKICVKSISSKQPRSIKNCKHQS